VGKETLIVNLWAGPGTGKSTTASVVFHMLKVAGIKCEYVTEFAKELAYAANDAEARAWWVKQYDPEVQKFKAAQAALRESRQ